MVRPVHIWSAAIGGLIIYDIRCDRDDIPGNTLSEVIRTHVRTHHPVGRAAFLLGWGTLTAWFVPHILATTAASSSGSRNC